MRREHGTGADPQHEQPEVAPVGMSHDVLQVREGTRTPPLSADRSTAAAREGVQYAT
ncbi:hypothetical protein Shyd_76920 [Streptomyces hydrogenans]|uniref:Uncharacterized protein n=1 Tax=Streptomyces hydrogenans TaxID=1873719 RepID=A0ABQ3PMS0_9ACTN|nr:hypothetical protein GCM10018784_24600 [Streptomyces hydrogenans]GHI26321.1 hypothetical protein Shyd_76920 [Streptomyces hydrogenans]